MSCEVQHYKLCSAVMKISSTEHCPVSVGEEVFCTVDGKDLELGYCQEIYDI